MGYCPQDHKELDMTEHACLHTPSFRKADSPPACVHQVIVMLTKSSDIPVLSHLCSSST